MSEPTGKVGNCLMCGRDFKPDHERSMGMGICEPCYDKLGQEAMGGPVIPWKDYTLKWLRENSPLFRLYQAIEKARRGKWGRDSEIAVKLSARDWYKVTQAIETLMNFEEGMQER